MFDYTVIVRAARPDEPIKEMYEAWMKQPNPPVRIIITTNGMEYDGFEVLKSTCIAKQTNLGVLNCDTEMFVLWNGDCIPSRNYFGTMLPYSNPYCLTFPIYAEIQTPGFEPRITLPFAIESGQSFGFNYHDLSIHYKSTWDWYNEAFDGYGYEDTDYLTRWIFKGRKWIGVTTARAYHVAHSRVLDPELRGKKIKNESIFNKLKPMYAMGRLPAMTATDRMFYP